MPGNNPSGRNQFTNCPSTQDTRVEQLLRKYHANGLTNNELISELLEVEHGIEMSGRSVARRRAAFNLTGGGLTTKNTPESVKRQAVLDQLAKDPLSRKGPRRVREEIVRDTGLLLSRDWITTEMHELDPDGFELRAPTAKKVHRSPLVALGPHHEWSADGHDKLNSIGFPIWAVRDKWSGKWLKGWVVPNNRLKEAVAYLYLSLVHEVGGIPMQSTTDCGSETTSMFALANALRQIFYPEIPLEVIPAHHYTESVHNITIERGWRCLRIEWGDNMKVFWEAGAMVYNSSDIRQYNLVRWLWSKLLQQELDALLNSFNNHRVRFDKNKLLPSGVSPDVAFTLCHRYGGQNCLLEVDRNVIQEMMDTIGDEAIRFVPREYEAWAEDVYATLTFTSLTPQNVWAVFVEMKRLMYSI